MTSSAGTERAPCFVGELDAVVIGAGFSGLYMLHALRQMGVSVHGFEAASGVGGTWYWNRYPGARCDSESMYYSYSFLPELEAEWPLRERYPSQPEILKYLERVAEVLDLARDFTFDARVERLDWNDLTGRWSLQTSRGQQATASYVVTAVGCLSTPSRPTLKGLDTFGGEVLHTGNWPHKPASFERRRVGVIGTGSSGIQAIPLIAQQAEHLTVFQRTPQFTVPAGNGPLDDDLVKMWKSNYREWRRRSKASRGGMPYSSSYLSALEVSAEERTGIYESRWSKGGNGFLAGSFNDIMADERANQTAADFVRSKIDEIVDDPSVADMLKPAYPIGSKRLPYDSGYYQTFNRPNVSLVDLGRTPIEEVVAGGIRTTTSLHPLDVIVFATGFDALTKPLLDLDIHGRDGLPLAEVWADGPRTYLGLAVPGFPNLFTITGPGSPSVLSTMPVAIEQHVEWIADCIRYMGDGGFDRVEATEAATTAWTDHVQEVANRTILAKAPSWYSGANIPGKPRVFLPYPGGVANYRQKCQVVVADGYAGFTFTDRRSPDGLSQGSHDHDAG